MVSQSTDPRSTTCQFKKEDGEFCKRNVASGETKCWQHTRSWSHKWKSLTKNQTIAFVGLLVSVFIVGVPGLYFSFVGWRDRRPQAPMLISPKPDPVIEISYDMLKTPLPFVLEPGSVTHILTIRQDHSVSTMSAMATKKSMWPTEKLIDPPEWEGQLRISNHGDVTVFNVSMKLKIDFQMRGVGPIIETTLPAIENLRTGGDPYILYVVNQSSYSGLLRLPENASMLVQGEIGPRQIKLTRRNLSILDEVPLLNPSRHKWEGNNLLEPDKLKHGKRTLDKN